MGFGGTGGQGMPDNSTLDLTAGGLLQIKDLGVSNAKIANATITFEKIGFMLPSLVSETTISGSDVQNIDFSNLNGNTHGGYLLVGTLQNNSGGNANYHVYFNQDYTNANYTEQRLASEGATTTSEATASAPTLNYATVGNTNEVSFVMWITRSVTGLIIARTQFWNQTTMHICESIVKKIATQTNITDIRISSTAAAGIKIGSNIKIYRLK